MSTNDFYTAEQIKSEYDRIAPVFISAFKGDPWFEVSKCVDTSTPKRCPNGFSALAISTSCEVCHETVNEPAYELKEVVDLFENHAQKYPTIWYTERVENGIALAGYASSHDRYSITDNTYKNSPGMSDWFADHIGDGQFAWLHELFADRSVRPNGNLCNFGRMCIEFADRFELSTLAYCTINPRMIAAATREFSTKAQVFAPHRQLPDHRNVVVIDL